jgi:starch-binding outer membrane protein, SusD/RagB family
LNYRLDVQNIEYYLAEARVLRAYYYMELIKRYGGVPLVTSILTYEDDTNLPKTEFPIVLDFIVSEIDSVMDSLIDDWKNFDSGYKGRISRPIALSIKLKALIMDASPLYSNDPLKWEKAAAVANEIVASNIFSLDPIYPALFRTDRTVKSVESIWEIRLNTTNDQERRNYPINTPGGRNEITPSHNLVSEYEIISATNNISLYAGRDPRLEYSIVVNNTSWNNRRIEIWEGGTDDYTKSNVSRTGYYLKKFLNVNLNLVENQSAQRSWIIYRYADILLNYAEAMNEAFGPDNNNGYSMTAREAVNRVRSRPGVLMPAVVAATADEMREKIKHERRIELAFEGHRYWDLIRWKDAEIALNTTITGVIPSILDDLTTFTYEVVDVESRVFDASKMYFFPIPWSEVSKSKGVLHQNPGW